MTVTFNIYKSVTMGQKPVLAVSVTSLTAESNEMAFAADLTKNVAEFAEKYGTEKSEGA